MSADKIRIKIQSLKYRLNTREGGGGETNKQTNKTEFSPS